MTNNFFHLSSILRQFTIVNNCLRCIKVWNLVSYKISQVISGEMTWRHSQALAANPDRNLVVEGEH